MILSASRKSPLSLQPKGSTLRLKSFQKRIEAIAYLSLLKQDKVPARCVGIALRDRTPQGELVSGVDLFEAGTVTGALGGGLLGPLLPWISPVASVRVPGLGPVVVGGVFARAFGIKRSSSRSPWLTSTPDEALDRLGLPVVESSEFVDALRRGEILVAFYPPSGAALPRFHRAGGSNNMLLGPRWGGDGAEISSESERWASVGETAV